MEIPSQEELIKSSGDFNVLPVVARKVLELVQDENASAYDISTALEMDQLITARVLRISNSAFYGSVQEITNLKQAIMLLGFNAIKEIVLAVSTKSLYKNFGITEKMMWSHSIGAAIATRIISAGMDKSIQEVSFIGGLMHDFGKVIMNNESPQIYAEVMMATYNEGIPAEVAEKRIYGYDHTEVGARVIEEWGFPALYVSILENHHLSMSSLSDIEDPHCAKVLACVHLANNICRRLGIGFKAPEEGVDIAGLESVEFLGIEADAIEPLLAEIKKTYDEEVSNFA